jgi:hypothetical protein
MNGNGNGDPVKDQEILDYIKSQRDNGFSDDVIGMQLQMRGVADFDTYLKKKDDTSISPSVSGEEGTESGQSTDPQQQQGAGSSVVPLNQNNSTVNTLANGRPDLSVNPITGEVTPWEDTDANRAALEIDPIHYDGFQKTGFIRAMESLDENYITPEIASVFTEFAGSSDWWWNSVGGSVDGIAAELAKSDEYLSSVGISVSPTTTDIRANPLYMSDFHGTGMFLDIPFRPNVPRQKTEEEIISEKTAAVKKLLNDQINENVVTSLKDAMPANVRQSNEALLHMEQFMLENYGSMLDLSGEGQVGNTPFLQFDGFEPSGYIGAGGPGYRPKFSGYLVDKLEAASIDLVNGIYNMFGGDEKTVVEMREKAEELRANTLQFTESMTGSFADGQFKNGLMQMGGFVSEATPTMAVLIPAAAVTTSLTGGTAAPWWVTTGLIGLEGATLSTAVEAARTRNHPMFKTYTKDGVTIGYYEMMEATGGDPELMGNYEEGFDDTARFGHLSTVFGTDFVATGATSLFFLKALKGAGAAGNVGPNMNGWWNAHLTNMGYSVPINSVTSSTAAMVQYMSLNPDASADEIFEVGYDVALGTVPITVGTVGTGSLINFHQTKAQVANALARDQVGRSGGNVKIHQQRTKFLEILRDPEGKYSRNDKIYAEQQLVRLEEQRLSTVAADENFYLRMNPEDYDNVVDLHREYNSIQRQLMKMEDPNSELAKGLRDQLETIQQKRLNIEKLYEVDPTLDADVTAPPADIFEPGPDAGPLQLSFTPGLAKWWQYEFFDKYSDVNMLQRSIMEALDTDETGARVPINQDFEVLQKLATSRAAYEVEQMINLRTQKGGLTDQLRQLQKTTDASLYEALPEVYDKNIIGLYDRWTVAKFAPERNQKVLADNQAELNKLKGKEDKTAADNNRIKFLEEKIAERRGSGMADEEAANFLNSLPEDLKLAFEKVREEHRAIQQNTRDAALRYGFIDQAMYDKLQTTAENYVTLTGDGMKSMDGSIQLIDNNIVEAIFPSRSGQSGVPDNLRKASGRSDETGSILAKTVDQNTQIHVAGQKNVALTGLYELLLNNPNPKHYTISDEGNSAAKNTVMVYINGEKKYMTFANEVYARAFKLQGPQGSEQMVRFINEGTRLLSNIPKMYTQYSTTFFLGNTPRDYQASIVNALAAAEKKFGFALYNAEGKPINTKQLVRDSHLVGRGEFMKAFKAIAADEFSPGSNYRGKDNVLYQEFKAHGGQTGWAYQTPLENLSKTLAAETDATVRGRKGMTWLKDNTLGMVESFNNTFENVFRFQVYKGLRNQGVIPEYAAAVAKDVSIDFNRSGATTPKLAWAKFFLNASLQGADFTVQNTIALRPKKDVEGNVRNPYQRLTNGQKIVLGGVGFMYTLTQFNQAVSEVDTDGVSFYDKIPDQIKQRNFIIMHPGSPTGERTEIAKVYGYGGIMDIGLTIAEVQNGERDIVDGSMYLASSLVKNLSPVHFRGVGEEDDPTKSVDVVQQPGLVVKAITQIDPIAPLIDVSQNVDAFNNPIVREPKEGESRAAQAEDSPAFMQDIFNFINQSEISGGSEQISGDFDYNPDLLNYLFKNYLGSSYVMFGDAGDMILDITANQDNVDTWPLIKNFYGQDNEYAAYGNYYDAKQVVGSYLSEFGNIEDLRENKDKPLPSRDERLADYAAVEDTPGAAKIRYGNAMAMSDLFSEIDKEINDMREDKEMIQKLQDDLEYDLFNLEVAEKWEGYEEKIRKFEDIEMKLMERALREYYKYYPKKGE